MSLLLMGAGPGTDSAGAWTPGSLPGTINWGESDPTKLYTDSGTTLVSADGQSVQQINNKSTGSNWRQTTVGNQPLYKVGTGGKHYLQFTAANSQTIGQLTNSVPGDANGQHWIALSLRPHTTANNEYLLYLSGSAAVSIVSNEFGTSKAFSVDSVGGFTGSTAGSLVANQPAVIIVEITSTTIEVFLDNVSGGATTLTGTRQNNSAQVQIGSNAGVANFADFDLFGLAHGTGLLGSTNRALMQTYMAALHP